MKRRMSSMVRRCIAVGMPVTRHPLRRSGREALPHPAPTSGLTANVPWATAGGTTTSLPYTRQRLGHAHPALRPVRVTCRLFPLVTALPSTHSAAPTGALFAGFCGTMLVSDFSSPCITGVGGVPSLCGPPIGPVRRSPSSRARSVYACWGSQTAQSPRPTRVRVCLDVAFHPPTSVGALDEQLSRRNTPPTCPPTDFSSASSRRPPHGSGPMWFARPSS
jgi:hypothetical protein